MADSEFESDDELFDWNEEEDEPQHQLAPERRNREQLYKLKRARHEFFAALDKYANVAGEEGLNEVVSQCERKLQWQLECVTDRATIDDILLRRYDIYEPDAWLRFRNSWFEKRVRNDMHHIGVMHSAMFARAVAKKSLPVKGRIMLYTRELFWSLIQHIDRKLQSH